MNNEIIFCATPGGNKKIKAVFQDETAWLTQKTMDERIQLFPFWKQLPPVKILIYEDLNAIRPVTSLIDKAVCAKFAQVQKNGFIRKKVGNTVIPAQAGIQVERNILKRLDSRLRGNDDLCLFNNVVA